MNKKILIVLGLVIIAGGVGFAVVWTGWSPDTAEQPEKKTINHFHPSKPPLTARADNLNNLSRALKQLNISQQFQESQFYSLYQTRIKTLMSTFRNEKYQSGMNALRTIRDYSGDRAILYGTVNPLQLVSVHNLSPTDTSTKQPYKAVDRLMKKVFNRLGDQPEVSVSRKKHRGVTIRSLKLSFDNGSDNQPSRDVQSLIDRLSPSMARLHNHLLFGIGKGALETSIDRYAKASSPTTLSLDAPSEDKPTLSYEVTGEFFVDVYGDLAKYLPDEMNRQNQFSLNQKLAKAQDHVEGEITTTDGFIHHSSSLKWIPDEMADTLARSLRTKPANLNSPRYFPQKTIVSVSALQPHADQMFDWYVNNVIEPRFFNSTNSDTASNVLEETLPMDGIRTFLGSLKSELGGAVYLNNDYFRQLHEQGGLPDEGLPGGIMAVFHVDNFSTLNQSLDSIDDNPFVTYQPLERKLVLDLILTELPIYLQKHRNHLLMTLQDSQLDSAIDRFNNSSGLPSLKRYRVLRNKVPDRLNNLTYFSVSPVAQPLQLNWIKKYLPNRRRQITLMTGGVDPIKEFGRFLRGLSGTMSATRHIPGKHLVNNDFYTSGDIAMPTVGIAAGVASYPFFAEDVNDRMEETVGDSSSSNTDTEDKQADQQSIGEGQAALSTAIYN